MEPTTVHTVSCNFYTKTFLFNTPHDSQTTYLFAAATPCHKAFSKIKNDYETNNNIIESYSIKSCQLTNKEMDSFFKENLDTNAPTVKESSACVVVLNLENNPIPELVVIDKANQFELKRDFNSSKVEKISSSLLGNKKTRTIFFIKLEYKNNNQMTPHTITRANLDLSTNQMRLIKWNVGFFRNDYSHDYTVKCSN